MSIDTTHFNVRLDSCQPSIDDPRSHFANSVTFTSQTASISRHKQRRFHVTNSVDFTSQTASLLLSTTVRRLLTPTLDHFHQRSTTPPFNTRHLLNQIANSPTISFSLFRFSRCRNKKSPILSMAPF